MTRPKHPLSLARKKYARHKAQAKFRNIGFNFTFDEWHTWWLSHGVDKNINIKWQGDYRPCMCRKGDLGDYEPNNVYFANHIDNVIDAHNNNRGNARGRRTDKNYRWGADLLTLNELRSKYNIPNGLLTFYRADTYDQKNHKETLKLINRYQNHTPNKIKKIWVTPAGSYEDLGEAAASVGLHKDTFRYWVNKGRYTRIIEQLVPPLKEYIILHSRYPDPYMPEDLV